MNGVEREIRALLGGTSRRHPMVRSCHQGPDRRAPRHVTGRPGIFWCSNCRRVVVRGWGRWWEQ